MKTAKTKYLVDWPATDPEVQFTFSTSTDDGTFTFKFKWLNDRWNCWVTLPDNTVRSCGVYPNVTNWTGYLDYGVYFSTSLENIAFDTLFMTELYIVTWQ